MDNPFFDRVNSQWKIKVKADDGQWKPKLLGKGVDGEPIPDDLLELAKPFMDRIKGDNAPTTKEVQIGTSLDSYFDLYLKRYLKREGSIRRLVYVLDHFRRFASENNIKTIEQVRIKEVNSFVDFRRAKGFMGRPSTKNSTIQAELAILQGVFRLAIVEEIISGINPVKYPAAQVREAIANEHANSDDEELLEEIKYYTRKQQSSIIDTLETYARREMTDIVKVMGATGMRVNAVVNRDFRWISDDNYVRIPRKFDKGKSGYTTHLFGPESRHVIARRRHAYQEGRVFPDVASGTQVYSHLDRFYHSHGLPDIAIMGFYNHAWRHSFAVNMIEEGMAIEILQKFMGHKSIKITQRYAQVSEDALIAAVAMIEKKYQPVIL